MANTTSFKKVVINSPIYTLGEILRRGGSFIFLPIFTRYVDPVEYGAAMLVSSVGTFVSAVFTVHLQAAVVRFTYDEPDNLEYLKKLYGTVFVFAGLFSISLFLISAVLVRPVLGLFDNSGFWSPYVFVMLTIALTQPFYEILQRVMQARHKAKVYVVQQSFYFLFGGSVSVVLVVGLGAGGIGILIGPALVSVMFYLYTWLYVRRNFGLRIDRGLLKECLKYSVPLLPNRFAGLLPSIMDRMFLSAHSVALVGTYSVGSRIGESLAYASSGFFRAHLPWFYRSMGEGQAAREQIIRVARQATLIISSLGLILSLFAEDLIRLILGPAYHDAWIVVPIAAFVVVFNQLKEFWLRALTYDKKGTRYVPLVTYTFAGLSVFLTAWLVPQYGMIGAALALLIARILSSLMMLYFSLKMQDIGFPVWGMYGIATGAFCLSLIAYLKVPGLLFIKIGVGIATMFIVMVASREEARLLLKMLLRERSVAVS